MVRLTNRMGRLLLKKVMANIWREKRERHKLYLFLRTKFLIAAKTKNINLDLTDFLQDLRRMRIQKLQSR